MSAGDLGVLPSPFNRQATDEIHCLLVGDTGRLPPTDSLDLEFADLATLPFHRDLDPMLLWRQHHPFQYAAQQTLAVARGGRRHVPHFPHVPRHAQDPFLFDLRRLLNRAV